jgi:hypothetical protein
MPVSARVRGEVYSIPTARLISLDNRLLNGVSFIRRRVWLNLPRVTNLKEVNGVAKYAIFDRMKAWMYFGREEAWADKLDAGYYFSPVTVYMGYPYPYSYFSLKELDGKASIE